MDLSFCNTKDNLWFFPDLKRRIKYVVRRVQILIDYYLSDDLAAKCKKDFFSSLAEAVRSIREDEVKPMLEKAKIYFPNYMLEITILEESRDAAAIVLLEKISNLIVILGGDLGEELRLLKNGVESIRIGLPDEEHKCVICGVNEEKTSHLFFSCCGTSEIWYKLISWLGVQWTPYINSKHHLFQFAGLK